MRVQVTLLVIPLFAFVGCDKFVDDVSAGSTPHDCDTQDEPHPYTTCVPDLELVGDDEDPWSSHETHPACTLGCGYLGIDDEGVGNMICGIPCESDAECSPYEGDGSPLTRCVEGRCYYFCDDTHTCPSDLECVGRGDPSPGDPNPNGECQAPYMEP